jgi:hypothetical protein
MSLSFNSVRGVVAGDGFPDLYVLNMQGDDHYLENQTGKRFVDKTVLVVAINQTLTITEPR